MEDLINRTIQWATNKGIYENSTADAQLLGALEELGECSTAWRDGDIEAAKMELGDVLVYLINYDQLEGKDHFDISEVTVKTCNQLSSWSFICIFDDVSARKAKSTRFGLAVIAAGLNSTPQECLELAVNKIEKRKHAGFKNGKLIKEGDE